MGCSGSNAMETQATCATEYEEMLKNAKAAQKGVGDLTAMTDLSGGIAKNWKLNNLPKNSSDAAKGTPTVPVLMDDNSKYLGGWKDGKKHGKGKQLFPDGSVFEGTWKDGHACGPCKLDVGQPVDGSAPPRFEGHVVNSMADGEGTFNYSDGSKITGIWRKDEKNGFFEEIWADGARFKGWYVDGKKEGLGFQIWADGSNYLGQFDADLIQGWGRYQWNDDRTVRAQWNNNVMHGYGHFYWEDGRVYKGEYAEGKKDGYGDFVWPDGRSTKGYWKGSQMHGLNRQTNKAGQSKWVYYNNGNRERFVDSASERQSIWKAEGLEENPKMPTLPAWLAQLPEAKLEDAEVISQYDVFTGRLDGLKNAENQSPKTVEASTKPEKAEKPEKEKKEKKGKKEAE